MIEYIKNIIPRIQRYSKDLSKIENFIDKNWIFIDENGSRHEYLFLRDKSLIMTAGSTTKRGTWELLPTGQLLITRAADDLIKLENMFVEQALLVLKRSATNDTPFVLINQQLIPDLDAVKYLEKYEHEKTIEQIPPSDHDYKLFDNGELYAPVAYVGRKIKIKNDLILNGTYKTTDKNTLKYIVIENNKITRIYYHEKYQFNTQELIIEVYDNEYLSKGDIVIQASFDQLPIGTRFTVVDKTGQHFIIKLNKDYKVAMSIDAEMILILKISAFALIILILFILIFSIRN